MNTSVEYTQIMNAKPSKTTNRLHFTDMDPTRFEDLCLALIYPLHPWSDIRHYGRLGGDGGVDILARERMDDADDREWFIQCRRYSKATKSTVIKAVDDALAKVKAVDDAQAKPTHAPDVLLVVLACDVSRTAHEAYTSYASSMGVSSPLLWTASLLEARLHAERRDLLFTYFGISEAAEARRREGTISRNIALKRRLRRELLRTTGVNRDRARTRPMEKFIASDVIVHSTDDTSYPDVDEERIGFSGWFKVEIWDFYHNGLEFVTGIDYGIVDGDGRWAVIGHDQPVGDEFKRIKMFRLAQIPYRNIVDFDTMGDEYYPQPHMYCRFADGGQPYEGFRWVLIDDDFPWPMEPELQFEIETAKQERPNDPPRSEGTPS